VNTEDLGAPCTSEFRNARGRRRVRAALPEQVVRDYGGGFIGLLRPELYERLLDALPKGVLRVNHTVERVEQDESGVRLLLADGRVHEADLVIGADGIDSLVRRTLWGDGPKREHNLHIFGGYTFDDSVETEPGMCVLSHTRTVQGSWTAIRDKGRDGHQWWVLEAFGAGREFTGDLHSTATSLGQAFARPLPQLIAATDPAHVQRWVIRDRKPLKQWSKGRATLVGDAAHPTSPYAGYGAGMATEDGYFIGRRLAGVDLGDYAAVRQALDAFEAPRKPHTARQSQHAYALGQVFHHAPRALQPIRDAILDHTPLMQKVVGDSTPISILTQLGEIDRAEARFTALLRLGETHDTAS
jgi:2-polyprenyl-6-methoxyphenol hydroxylase-like FAD-dependent oxidoreductase